MRPITPMPTCTLRQFRAVILQSEGEPEFELYFRNRSAYYMVIRYEDRVSFQRCGFDTGSGEVYYDDFDALASSETVDGILLERDWGDIEEIVCNASVDIAEYCWINHIDMDGI